MKTPMLGSAYRSRSPNLANQAAINIYPEIVESKSGKEVGAFYGTPGLILKVNLPGGPIRAERALGLTLYVVAGSSVYAVQADFSYTLLGSIATSTGPVSMVDNGVQVGIFDSVGGYSIIANVMANITLPFPNPGTATYQDGFVLVNQVGTFIIWQSNLNDLTTWDPLNFSTEDGQPDDVVALADLHRQVIVFKQDHTAFWINAGTSGFVFQRLDGVYPNTGLAAVQSVAECGEAVVWLGMNEEGTNSVFLATGYEPERVSTYALETALASYPTTADAIAYSYRATGHLFYVVSFPSGNATWALDLTASKQMGYPIWHQRAYFNEGVLSRHLAQCQAFFNGQTIVGDYTTGNLYAFDLDTYTDNGQPIKRVRSWRALAQATIQSAKFNCLEIDLEAGIGVPPTTNPQLVLRTSDDGGYHWSNERFQPAGVTGATKARVKFNRLGMKRRGLAQDRIFELSTTDAFKIAWLGADVR